MSTTLVAPTVRYDIAQASRLRHNAALKRPIEITHWSYDDKHEYHPDASSIKYYYPPEIGASLSKGFDTFQKLDDSADEHLGSFLKAIEALERERGQKVDAEIVAYRGMMTKIMDIPYDRFNKGFEMNATLFQNTIFIEQNNDYKRQEKAQQTLQQPTRPGQPSQDLMMYWGYKFETLALLPDTWDATSREYIENRENEIVNNAAQYISVVETGVSGVKLCIAGEVDGVWSIAPDPSDPSANPDYLELKTTAEINSDRDIPKFESKLRKMWAQSYLLGVQRIIIGFRGSNMDGTLLRVKEYHTREIPGMVVEQSRRRGQREPAWDSNCCINFLGDFLQFLRRTITTPGIWRIRRLDNSPTIEVFRIENTGYGKILSSEFVRWRGEGVGGVDAEQMSQEGEGLAGAREGEGEGVGGVDTDADEALAHEVSEELEREVQEMELERQRASLLARLAAIGGGG